MNIMSAANKNASKPPRPCTEYNIFFQLERAYILQVVLSAPPENTSCCPDEVFRPSQPTYAGLPPLPSRYASLVLPYDWHLPGKERRRKRKHRKTHGAIGFQDLSLRIANAWRECDDVEIRSYCAEVCHVGMTKYKREMREWKKCQKNKAKPASKPTSSASARDDEKSALEMSAGNGRPKLLKALSDNSFFADESPSFADDVTRLFDNAQGGNNVLGFDFTQNQPQVDLSFDNLSSLTTIGDMVQPSSQNFNRRESTLTTYADVNITSRAVQCTPSSVYSDVDIEDDEIISMWKAGDEGSSSNKSSYQSGSNVYCRDCTPPPAGIFGTRNDTFAPQAQARVKSEDKSIDVQYRTTFGPDGWSATLQDMQAMQDALRRQQEQLVELEKKTVVARSA